MGPLPSSRLTRILQEKAEHLKKRRQGAEQALRDSEDRVRLLESLGIKLPDVVERQAQLKELARKADWERVEAEAKTFLAALEASTKAEFDARRRTALDLSGRLLTAGAEVSEEFRSLIKNLQDPPPDHSWNATVEEVVRVDAALNKIEADFQDQLRRQADTVAEWASATPDVRERFAQETNEIVEPIVSGGAVEAVAALNARASALLPDAVARRTGAQETVKRLIEAARSLGAPVATLEAAIEADRSAAPLSWPVTAGALETTATEMTSALRERVVSAVLGMRATLSSLKELGVDPTETIVRVEELQGRIALAGPNELPRIFDEARTATEQPIVAIVAGLLDEVRPRLVEARRLGRDPSEVFAAMNRAREALRLKIYSEALAAAQESLDRVAALTSDLDAARDESESLTQLLDSLSRSKVPVQAFRHSLETAQLHLQQMDVDAARNLLQQTIREIGVHAYDFFAQSLARIETLGRMSKDAGFLSEEEEKALGEARHLLDEGALIQVGEKLADIDVKLRTSAAPYVARRVEELEKGFVEIQNDDVIAPVRRALADADVSLRVKEDLASSLDGLKRADREFATIFAAHTSALVETLEDERRTLETMGGAGDEIQRQIDEVQQIYNMGDFVKASRASQEIRQRAHEQELVRSEEALSHAKLALVELAKMGLDVVGLRATLETAQDLAQNGRYADAYRIASESEKQAVDLARQAQAIAEGLVTATDRWQKMSRDGVEVSAYSDRISQARAAYQAMDFVQAQRVLDEVNQRLRSDDAFQETTRLTHDVGLLLEEAKRLSVPVDKVEGDLTGIRQQLNSEDPLPTLERTRALHADLVARLRPIIEENLKGLEQDLDIARQVASDIGSAVELVSDARRKSGLPVPVGVAEAIELAHARLTESRGFREQAERGMRRAQEALNQAELVHVGVAVPRKEMDRIEERFGERDYARVIERSATLERELNQLIYQHLSKTLNAFQGMLTRARDQGSDTALAENLLRQSRTSLQEGRALEALQLATRSEVEIERVELQVRLAQGALETLESKYATIQTEGLRSPSAGEELSKARLAFERKDFVTVLEHVFSAADSLTYSRDSFRRARDLLDSAESQLAEAMRHGADLDEVAPVIESARHHLTQGDYAEASRRAREATDLGRWAIERQSTAVLEDVRRLVEIVRQAGITEGLENLQDLVQTAEIALKSHEWTSSAHALDQARAAAGHRLDEWIRVRQSELETIYSQHEGPSPEENDLRSEVLKRLTADAEQHEYLRALRLIDEEVKRVEDQRRTALGQMVSDFKDRLWVGERLGLDTTPVMELFSEAKMALDAGKIGSVPGLLANAETVLATLVRGRLPDKARDVSTEMVFAQDGLHVILGTVPASLKKADELLAAGEVVRAAQTVLEAEQELNARKAMHRELLNIHYLVDAALARAAERHLPTEEARKLLSESIDLRNSDYSAALDRARQALAILQGSLRTPAEAPTAGFWPFKRPPS